MTSISKSGMNESQIKVMAAVILTASLLVIHLVDPSFYPTAWSLTTRGNVKDFIEFLRSYGLWAMAVSIYIDILINALGFLPSIFISTANGVLFGVIPGIIISWVAESIGVIISFFLMRSVLRRSAEILINKSNYLRKVDEFSSQNGLKVMLFARTLPYFPSGVITALGAVSSISVRDYVIATFVGKFPSTALEVIIGHDVVNYEKHVARLAVIVVVVFAVYLGLWHLYGKEKPASGGEE